MVDENVPCMHYIKEFFFDLETMDYEEYSLHSPAPHLVPSSPFIFTHDTNSQVAKVPDIDRMNRRVPIGKLW